jgi:hypothetical protein
MLARRLTTLLPAMSLAEAIDTTRIHRVAGLTGGRAAFVTTRPFRAPHHTISAVGLIGGGQVPMPGEVSRAHHGVLCLDELPECRRHGLAGLRQPLEDGVTKSPPPGCPGSRCSSRNRCRVATITGPTEPWSRRRNWLPAKVGSEDHTSVDKPARRPYTLAQIPSCGSCQRYRPLADTGEPADVSGRC